MAHTPPPFETYQSPNQRKTTNPLMWVAVALVGFCCIALIAGAAMVFNAGKTVLSSAGCVLNFAMAQKSIAAYVRVNGHYPPAASWQIDTQEYYAKIYDKMMKGGKKDQERAMAMFKFAKPGEVMKCEGEGQATGVTYNADLSNKPVDEIKDKSTILLFESHSVTLNSNAAYAKPTGPAPKVFGSSRGWFTFPIEGKSDMFKSKNSDYSINDEDMTLSDEELGIKPGADSGKGTGKPDAKAADKSGV